MAASGPSALQEPVDLSHHYSHITKSRVASSVKDFYKYFAIPGIAQLAGGLPNHNNFPFDTLEAKVALPDRFKPTPNDPVDPLADFSHPATPSALPNSQVVVPKVAGSNHVLRSIDIKSALQYGTAQGYPPLYSFLRQFTRENLHPNVPYVGGPDIILTVGSTDGFAKALELLSNPWIEGKDWARDREGLLVEEFAYMNAVQAAWPRGLSINPVAMDSEGMLADGSGGLEHVLSHWDETKGKRPHLMYTVTIGQNPTSGTLGIERRKALYALCVKYDVIIIEDDPYWYLQYPSANAASLAARGHPASTDAQPGTVNYNAPRSSGFAFLDSLVPSYLSIDYQGRVLRLDTFSKTVAPGCRLGWITAQPHFCERLLRITETSTQQPSGFVQATMAELIMGTQHRDARHHGGWHVEGWVRWLEGLRGDYERRMQAMCQALEAGRYLLKAGRRPSLSDDPTSSIGVNDHRTEWSVVEKALMYDFTWPLGGMFVWVRLNLASHPLWRKTTPAHLSHACWAYLTTTPFLVLVCPGGIFCPTEESRAAKGWMYMRLCFAAVERDEVEATSLRFVEGIRSFWGKKRLEDIEDAVEEGVKDGCVQQ